MLRWSKAKRLEKDMYTVGEVKVRPLYVAVTGAVPVAEGMMTERLPVHQSFSTVRFAKLSVSD